MGQTEAQSFNAFGQLARKVDFRGQSTEFVYDSLGRVQTKNLFAVGAQQSTESITFEYDEQGRPKKM